MKFNYPSLLVSLFVLIGSNKSFAQVPQPTYPADNGAMHITDSLRWTTVNGSTSYDVTLGNDVNFTTFTNFSNITVTFLSPPFLSSDKTYFWRVRANTGASQGPWSSVLSFRIFTPGFVISPPILPEFNITDIASIQMANLTTTGSKEILFIASRNPSTVKNAYRIRNVNGNWIVADSFFNSLSDIYRKNTPYPADLDNDGDLDIIGREELIWNENGQFAKSPFSSLIAPVISENSIDRGNDGKNDAFFSLSGFAKNNGNRNFQFNAPNYFLSLDDSYADFNKDRRMDWARRDGYIGYHHPKRDTVDINYWLGQITSPNAQMLSPCIEDFDGNGWLDLAVLIYDGTSVTSLYIYYFNSTGRPFSTVSFPSNLGQVTLLKASDLNNDGKPDLIYGDAPNNLIMVCWNVNGQLHPVNSKPLFGRSGSMTRMQPAVGDIDGDSDADIVLMDWAGKIRILENVAAQPNTKPSPPFMKRAKFDADTVIFTWNRSTDNQQASQTLQYNLRAGTTKYGGQISSVTSDSITGLRYLYSHANTSQDTTWLLKGIKPGLYYYAAQSIDASKTGSVFSNVDSIFVCKPVNALLPLHPLLAADTTLLFKWTTGSFATHYQLQLAYDSLFTSIARDTIISDTTFIQRNLPGDTTLYWHVRSVNQDGTSAWTGKRLIDTRRIALKLTWNYSKPLCSNTSRGMSVLVYTKGLWNSGNQFILEISDQLGNFANSRILITVTDSIAPEVMRFTCRNIPFTTGSNYLLRVRSTFPLLQSIVSPPFGIRFNDYTAFFAIQPAAVCFGTNVTATYTEFTGTSDSSYWYKNYAFIRKVNAPGRGITFSQPGFYTVEAYYSDICMAVDTILYKGIDCYKVWPGDANSDTWVNELDIFTIGKYFGKTGTARTDQGNDWRAYTASNWNNIQDNYFNLKHVDCNGDSTINYMDTTAVSLNFTNTHLLARTTEQLTDTLIQTTDPVQVTFDQTTYRPGDIVSGKVIIGNSLKQVLISGIAFDLNIADSLMVPGTFKINTDSTGIFYLHGPGLYLNKNKKWIAHTATGRHISGNGSVAKFSFTLKNIPSGTLLTASTSNIVLTNLKGKLWSSISSKAGTATSTNIITGTVDPTPNEASITILPNPVFDKVIKINAALLRSDNVTINVYDATGRPLKTKFAKWLTGNNTTTVELPAAIKSGIYFVQIVSSKWNVTRKILVL